jgi:hypothetical protein
VHSPGLGLGHFWVGHSQFQAAFLQAHSPEGKRLLVKL